MGEVCSLRERKSMGITANEWGYGYARLTAWANNGATSVAGVWSSDCAGSYPSINA